MKTKTGSPLGTYPKQFQEHLGRAGSRVMPPSVRQIESKLRQARPE